MDDTPKRIPYIRIIRGVMLVLLIISMLGPWMFDLIYVPAEYTCDLPNIRLHGDFCGLPVSGVYFFELFIGGFFQGLFGWITGTPIMHPREMLIGLSILPLIPFSTTLLLLWKKETRHLRTINLISWILALLPTLMVFTVQINDKVNLLWGLWLYIITTISAIIMEIFVRK